MGSRAVALVCRDGDAARDRFGAAEGATGALYTRTGRRSFAGADRGAARPDCVGGGDRRPVGPAGHRLAAAGRRAAAVVGQGGRAAPPAVRGGRCRGRRRACPRPFGATGCGGARPRRRGAAGPHAWRAPRTRSVRRAYRRYCWPIDGLDGVSSRRSSCWPARAGRGPRSAARLALGWPTDWSQPTRSLVRTTDGCMVDTADAVSVAGRRRVVAGADRRRRRGDGGEARWPTWSGRTAVGRSPASRCRGP